MNLVHSLHPRRLNSEVMIKLMPQTNSATHNTTHVLYFEKLYPQFPQIVSQMRTCISFNFWQIESNGAVGDSSMENGTANALKSPVTLFEYTRNRKKYLLEKYTILSPHITRSPLDCRLVEKFLSYYYYYYYLKSKKKFPLRH